MLNICAVSNYIQSILSKCLAPLALLCVSSVYLLNRYYLNWDVFHSALTRFIILSLSQDARNKGY